jgi:hypothetical protein
MRPFPFCQAVNSGWCGIVASWHRGMAASWWQTTATRVVPFAYTGVVSKNAVLRECNSAAQCVRYHVTLCARE